MSDIMEHLRDSKIDAKWINVALGVAMVAIALYQFLVIQQAKAFENSVIQNRDNITEIIRDMSEIKSVLHSLSDRDQPDIADLKRQIEVHDRKLKLLNETVNRLHPVGP